MNSNKPLFIIGAIIVLAIIGVIAFAMTRDDNGSDMDMGGMNAQNESSNGSQQADAADAEETNEVTIKNFLYAPATIKVKVGTTVTWTNEDTVEHTVTSEEGAPESFGSELFGKGKTFSYTFENAGSFNYFCEPHPYMKGTVIVTE